MDPQASAREMVERARSIIALIDERGPLDYERCDRLADLAIALAERSLALAAWLAGGGFPPDWCRALER